MALSANELRVGNWVKQNEKAVSGSHYPGEIFIWDIDDFYDLASNKPSIVAFDSVPLTEEWLLKFGFERENVGVGFCAYEYNKKLRPDTEDVFYVRPYFQGGFIWGFKGNEIGEIGTPIAIEYVHHLQNFYFALTGEELTINLMATGKQYQLQAITFQ